MGLVEAGSFFVILPGVINGPHMILAILKKAFSSNEMGCNHSCSGHIVIPFSLHSVHGLMKTDRSPLHDRRESAEGQQYYKDNNLGKQTRLCLFLIST